MKKFLFLFLCLFLCFLLVPVVKANEVLFIEDYVTTNPLYKWYDGKDKWSSTMDSPVGLVVDSSLVEGVDYIREYAFTRDRNVNPDDDLEWKDSALGMSQSGFIWERIKGLGNYVGDIAVRNEIYTYIYVTASDFTKTEGDEDPEFAYTVKLHNDNPNNVIDLFDVSFEREKGEEPGTYKITPVIKPKEGTLESELVTHNTMAIGDYTNGRIYFGIIPGTLTIKELELGKLIVKYIDEETGKTLDIEESEGKIGSVYKTTAKVIKGYTFTKVKGNINGRYEQKDTTVIYYYSKEQMHLEKEKNYEDIITPPDTGIDDYNTVFKVFPFCKKFN